MVFLSHNYLMSPNLFIDYKSSFRQETKDHTPGGGGGETEDSSNSFLTNMVEPKYCRIAEGGEVGID